MNATVTHDRTEETMEAKTLWFRSLTLAERMEMLCAFTELLLMANPRIVEQKNAEPVEGRVLVLTVASSPLPRNRRGRGGAPRRSARNV
jgi:hypothetical protein